MSKKTEQFNVTITLGKKVFKPGEPVPVGAAGLSDDEVKNIRDAFGDYTGGPSVKEGAAPSSADLARFRDEFEALTTERDQLLGKVDTLTAERDTALENSRVLSKKNDDLEAELDQAGTDQTVLADQVKLLQAEKDQSIKDNKVLADQVKTLQAEVEKLKAK